MKNYIVEWNDGKGITIKYTIIEANTPKEATKKWQNKIKQHYKKPLHILNKEITLLRVEEEYKGE